MIESAGFAESSGSLPQVSKKGPWAGWSAQSGLIKCVRSTKTADYNDSMIHCDHMATCF